MGTSSVSLLWQGGKPGYRFTAMGTFDRLLAGVKVVNESGGGQAIQLSLAPILCFAIQGVALVA